MDDRLGGGMINQPIRDVLAGKAIQTLITVAPEATVAEAVHLMNQRGVGAVIVRGADGRIAGIFTERDVMCRVVDEKRDAAGTAVSAVMSPNVRQVNADATVEEVLRLMVVHNHRHVLVQDGPATFGLVSIRDLMQFLVLPDEPIAAEGRAGVLRARAADAVETVRHLER
jgi:CBS domain-containing protein